jgi:phosphatidate cytidylyltransferase
LSNLTQRILTAAVAIPLIVAICIAGGLYFFAFVTIVSAVALYEFYGLTKAKGAQPQIALGLFSGFLVNLSFYHSKLQNFVAGLFLERGMAIPFPSQTQLLFIVILLSVATMGVVELFRNKGSALINLSMTLFGVLYVSLFFGTFIGLREVFTSHDPVVFRYFVTMLGIMDGDQIYRFGGYTVISIFAIIWICDSAAYHFGMAMGKHKLFPRVSPNKSWEGAIFGFVFAVGSAVAAKYLVLDYLSVSGAVIVGVVVGVFGQIGDLIESLLKRDAGVKDSSNLIPGHGGAFDRFDSLLLVAPLVYYYIDFILFS